VGKRVVFNGVAMDATWPPRIDQAQSMTHYTEGGVRYPRVRYGDEDPRWGSIPCNGCGVVKGQFHVPDCEFEQCPKCGDGSAAGHPCEFEELYDAEANRHERPAARLIRWVGFTAFLAGVLALLRMAP
jgi:hypothetical protein